jgi:hypothetical protein
MMATEKTMRRNILRGVPVFVTMALAALAAAPAGALAADGGSRQSLGLAFTEQRPGTSTGVDLSIDYVNPTDPSAKPPAVRSVVEQFARGTHIDTSVPDQCTANDAQLMSLGPDACPAGSRVGTGTIRLDTGFPGPARFIDAHVVFLNNAGELIFVSSEMISGGRVVTRSQVSDAQIVNSAPLLPGTPPDGAAIDVVQVRLDAVSREVDGRQRGYITTPASCPSTAAWTNSVQFTYADDVTQAVSADSPCVAAAAPTVAASGSPRGRKAKCKRKRHRSAKKRKRCRSKRAHP